MSEREVGDNVECPTREEVVLVGRGFDDSVWAERGVTVIGVAKENPENGLACTVSDDFNPFCSGALSELKDEPLSNEKPENGVVEGAAACRGGAEAGAAGGANVNEFEDDDSGVEPKLKKFV